MKTSLYAILCIVIRVGAVVLAIGTVAALPPELASLGSAGVPEDALWKALAITGGILLLSALLWLHPGLLARLATDRSSQQVFESPIDAKDLHWIALSVVGAYFVVVGLVDTIGWLTQFWVVSAQVDELHARFLPPYMFGGLVSSVLEFVVGCLLALGSRSLVRLLQTLRYASPAAPARSTEEPS